MTTDTNTADIPIGHVQWHTSEVDGGPDVGKLLRLSAEQYLWSGELLDAESDSPVGLVLYDGKEKRVLGPCDMEVGHDVIDVVSAAMRPLLSTIDALEARVAELTAERDALRSASTIIRQRDEAVEALKVARRALVDHNEMLRSACQIAERDGQETNWLSFRGQIRYTLAEHHETTNTARQALATISKITGEEPR